MTDNLKSNIENGKKKMMEVCPACAPEFGDEWAKRMLARTKVDEFVDVSVRVYEKYFNDADVTEMIAMAAARKSGMEIEKEHPEWVPKTAPADAPK